MSRDATFASTIVDDLERGEKPIPLSELPDEPFVPRRCGKKVHLATIYRLAQSGQLETSRAIGQRFTTKSAWLRMIARRAAGPVGAAPLKKSSATRQREIDRARATLAAAGVVERMTFEKEEKQLRPGRLPLTRASVWSGSGIISKPRP